MKRFKKIIIVLVVLYGFLTISMAYFQERLIFFPSKMPMNHTYQFCQEFEEFNLKTKDGANLNAVHIKQDSAKGVVLYFHGNSGNVSNLSHVANLLYSKGYDAFLIDYRTYGKSTGKLTGIVSGLASNNEPQRVILESPFNSAVALGKHRFPILPVGWLSKYRFPSDEKENVHY